MKLEKVKEKLEEIESIVAEAESEKLFLDGSQYLKILETYLWNLKRKLEDADYMKSELKMNPRGLHLSLCVWEDNVRLRDENEEKYERGVQIHENVVRLMKEMGDLYNGQQE